MHAVKEEQASSVRVNQAISSAGMLACIVIVVSSKASPLVRTCCCTTLSRVVAQHCLLCLVVAIPT